MQQNQFFQRKIYKTLKEHLKSHHITVLTGMRRTGKTTLIQRLFNDISSNNKILLDLERLDTRELFSQKNYENIIVNLQQRGLNTNQKLYLLLDEIQLALNAPSVMKYLYDKYSIKFIVTGSSSYYIKNLFSESLAGRKKIFELYPLDFGEFLTFKKMPYEETDFLKSSFNVYEFERLKELYEEFIVFGGFPEVVLLPSQQEKQDLLQDIITSYLSIDIKTFSDFRKSEDVYRLIKMLGARIGTRLDYSKLSRLTGLSRITVQSYVDLFDKTYLIARVPVYTHNRDREIVKAQKIYFSDTGLANILAEPGSGAQFENTLFTQLRHKGDLRYFALKTGREIDFVLDKTALEAKENPTESDKKNLENLSKLAGLAAFQVIGRYQSPMFKDYIWGGDIR